MLAPPALERRSSGVEGSLEALLLTPQHEYSHLVIGAQNPDLPPPFTPGTFRRYMRRAWLCEGAATWLSGQTGHLRAAVVRRLREGGRPDFPPSTRDAQLLGGTLFAMLEEESGPEAPVELAATREDGARPAGHRARLRAPGRGGRARLARLPGVARRRRLRLSRH